MQVIGSQKGIITLSRRDEAYASRYKARKRKPSGFFTKQENRDRSRMLKLEYNRKEVYYEKETQFPKRDTHKF